MSVMDTQDIIFSANCYISGILSISMSGMLFYAIVKHTPHEMKNYKVFLLNINISDMLVSFFMTILQWIPASSKKEVGNRLNWFSSILFRSKDLPMTREFPM